MRVARMTHLDILVEPACVLYFREIRAAQGKNPSASAAVYAASACSPPGSQAMY
jgi:hypothetical protein